MSTMDIEAGRSSGVTRTKSVRPSGVTGRFGRLVLPLLLSSFVVCFYMLWQSSGQFKLVLSSGARDADTLVVYVYSNTDPEYESNLVYFLEKGVAAGDGCDYVIIIQEGTDTSETHNLPDTPANVRFVRHANECFDWGTFGWALENKVIDTSKYKYVILLNSSVRGPFLPPYWPPYLHWSDALTSRINQEVKLVGATISCEGSWKGGVLTGEKRQNPHVQSYVVALDQLGLALVREDPTVLKCYQRYHDAVWYGEMGSSAAILRAGYNIDSLMMRYQGVDWRQTENWGCNAALNPYAEHMYDGIDLSPFEIMFIKLKEYLLEANWTTATQGKKYSDWNTHPTDIRQNEYIAKKAHLRLIKILGMRARGNACFDFDLYRKRNPDLPQWDNKELWEHFVRFGQHEGRVFRFKCPPGQSDKSQVASSDIKTLDAAVTAASEAAGGTSLPASVVDKAVAAAVEAAKSAVAAAAGAAAADAPPAASQQQTAVAAAAAGNASAAASDAGGAPGNASAAASETQQASSPAVQPGEQQQLQQQMPPPPPPSPPQQQQQQSVVGSSVQQGGVQQGVQPSPAQQSGQESSGGGSSSSVQSSPAGASVQQSPTTLEAGLSSVITSPQQSPLGAAAAAAASVQPSQAASSTQPSPGASSTQPSLAVASPQLNSALASPEPSTAGMGGSRAEPATISPGVSPSQWGQQAVEAGEGQQVSPA